MLDESACTSVAETRAFFNKFLEMGSPKQLTAAQVAHLNELTRDLPETDKAMRSGSDGTIEFSIPMNSNDIVLVKLLRIRKAI